MRKITALIAGIIMLATLALGMAGCSDDANYDYVIGIVQHAPHDALDAARNGFQDELRALLLAEGKTVKFDAKNAQDDKSNMGTIAENFVSRGVSLILSIGTGATNAAISKADQAQSNIPVLFTAVTDPLAENFVESWAVPGKNATGTSDINPMEEQAQLLAELVGTGKKLGIIYNSDEPNSQVQADAMEDLALDEGFTEVVIRTITKANEISAAFTYLAANTDIVYIPTDNTLSTNISIIHSTNLQLTKKVPVVCGEIGMNDTSGVATYGIDYYKLGQQTAVMAYKVLFEGIDVGTISVEKQNEYLFSVNTKVAQEIGFIIPQFLLDRANGGE